MTLAIIGGRDYQDQSRVEENFLALRKVFPIDKIVSGAARGADTLGANVARKFGIQLTEFPADWDRFGKKAGFIRNELIVKAADIICAYWNSESKGTAHSLSLAKKMKKTTIIFYY